MASRASFIPRQDRADMQPSDILLRATGAAAPALARIWPRPHRGFFALEPARRHVATLIALRVGQQVASPSLADDLQTWALKRLLTDHMPDAPDGLLEALRKLLAAVEPSRIWVLLAQGGYGAKTLRHASQIDLALVEVLEALPATLRRHRIVRWLPRRANAVLAAAAARQACGDPISLAALAQRLERAASTASLFRMLIEAIGLERLAPPPVPGAPWFVPIASVAAIKSAALRFENCLRSRIPDLLSGECAYYEVLGDEPAVVEIVRDAAGLWTIGEIRGHANAPISPALHRRIREYLTRQGAAGQPRRNDLARQLAQVAW